MARPGERMTSERRLAALEKQRQALELRKAGLDFRTIAERIGYRSVASAHDAVRLALKQTLQEPADELRTLEVKRLDQMLLGLWSKATKGDTWAIDRVLKIMERRASLLGLDAPVKREETLHVTFQRLAESVAKDLDLEPAELVAEAERIIAQAARP